MPPGKKIVVNPFEKIKEETKKAAEEVSPTKFAEDVAEQTGLKSQEKSPQESGIEQPQAGRPVQKTPVDDAKKKALTAQRLKQLEEEIEIIRKKREREEEETRKEVPGGDVEAKRKISQLGEDLPAGSQEKKPLPPPVAAAKRKTGTGERRIKGVSG